MIWYDQVDNSEAKPCQWYYNGQPCEWIAAAVDETQEGKHLGNRYKLADGSTVEVFWDDDGKLPGVAYELLTHQPGHG